MFKNLEATAMSTKVLPELGSCPIATIAEGLHQDSLGIWQSAAMNAISYPEEGNAECFRIEDSSYWFQHRNSCITTLVRRYSPTGPIMDIGGGNGFVTRALMDHGFEAILLEPGAAGAFNAKVNRGVSSVICSDLANAGIKPESVDAAGLFDVLEHIRDDRDFASQIRFILRPGGLLYGTVPAHNWLWSHSDVEAGHYRRFDRHSLSQTLGGKFQLLWFSYMFAPLVVPLFCLRTVPSILRIGKGKKALSVSTEHGTSGGASVTVLKKLLAREAASIARGAAQSFGTSCLFVARKS
jgi:SAM-dependent methyltransferase